MLEIEFLSADKLNEQANKIDFIMTNIKNDKVLVIDTALTPLEERQLIEETMKNITLKFSGIEISTLGKAGDGLRERAIELLGGKTGLTIIGPSKLIKGFKRDPSSIKMLMK